MFISETVVFYFKCFAHSLVERAYVGHGGEISHQQLYNFSEFVSSCKITIFCRNKKPFSGRYGAVTAILRDALV